MATFPVDANVKPALDEIDRLIDALRKTGKQAGLSEDAIEKMVNETKKAGKDGVKNVNNLNSELGKTGGIIKTVGAGLATLFALDRLKAFTQEVIHITAEFQRMEAVLANTLGSRSQAQATMLQIQKLAATTPFSVRELTENFVKLANRGLRPTMEEMKKMGDVAATLGKPFEQVVEAILDISNSERWREIGIQSEKAGDKMKLTFRGVTQVVDNTVQGVEDAIVKFGEMNGVLGATDAITATLGGSTSALVDAWELFLDTLGEGNSGPLKATIDLMTQFVYKLKEVVTTEAQRHHEDAIAVYERQAKRLRSLYEQTNDLSKAQNQASQELSGHIAELQRQLTNLDESIANTRKEGSGSGFAMFTPDFWANAKKFDAQIELRKSLQRQLNNLQNEGKKAIEETTAEITKLDEAERQRLLNIQLAKDAAERERINKELEKKFKLITEIEEKETKLITGNPDDYLNAGKPHAFDPINDPYAAEREKERERERKLLAEQAEAERKQAELIKGYYTAAFDEIFNARAYQVQRELSALQSQYQYEISMAGTNSDAKEKIRQDFARREAALQEKLGRIQQEQAIFQIAVSEGPAIAKTIANVGMPWAIPLVAALGFLFASQINRAKGVKQPRYAADGDFDIDGPGTETSDDIPYMLSRRESVVHASGTKRFGKILQPIINDKDFTWGELKNIVDKELNVSLPPMVFARAGADSSELRDEMRAVRKAIENKQEHRFSFDENGFGHWMGNKGNWTKFIKSKYSM